MGQAYLRSNEGETGGPCQKPARNQPETARSFDVKREKLLLFCQQIGPTVTKVEDKKYYEYQEPTQSEQMLSWTRTHTGNYRNKDP